MIGVSSKVAGPVKSTIIIPNRKDIFSSIDNRLHFLPKDLSHERNEVFCWVAIYRDYFIAFLSTELLHYSLDNCIRICVEFLEIMAKVAHDVSTLKDTFQERVLVTHVLNVTLFCLTDILFDVSTDKLVLKTMNRPSYMGR